MKKTILFLLTLSFLISCSENNDDNIENTQLIGKWKLIEQLADPGDGSGTFKSIESQKFIEFKDEGIITSNGSLCDPYSDEQISSGTYSISEGKITTNCQNPNIAFIGFIIEDGHLILNFASNEGFSQKFQKLD
jgi:heat shock protein HslJ